MKKLIFITLCIALLAASCKNKEEEPVLADNAFTVDSKSYETPDATFSLKNETGTYEVYEITLQKGTIENVYVGGVLTMSGQLVKLDIIQPLQSGTVKEGTYTYKTTKEINAFTAGYVLLPLATTASSAPKNVKVQINPFSKAPSASAKYTYSTTTSSTGKVTLKKSGSNYIIDYEFTVQGGKTVKGYYNGTLTQTYE